MGLTRQSGETDDWLEAEYGVPREEGWRLIREAQYQMVRKLHERLLDLGYKRIKK